MRFAGHSFSPGTQQCYCGSNSGQELADLFLHVGSGWFSDATEAVMNDSSLLLSSGRQTDGNCQEMAGRDGTDRATVLSPVVLSRLLTRTATPTVTSRVSSTHREGAVLWNRARQQGVGLGFRQWAGNNLSKGWASHGETCIIQTGLANTPHRCRFIRYT